MGLATDIADKQQSALPLGKAAEKIYQQVVAGPGAEGLFVNVSIPARRTEAGLRETVNDRIGY